jgi:hypothetical protein
MAEHGLEPEKSLCAVKVHGYLTEQSLPGGDSPGTGIGGHYCRPEFRSCSVGFEGLTKVSFLVRSQLLICFSQVNLTQIACACSQTDAGNWSYLHRGFHMGSQ